MRIGFVLKKQLFQMTCSLFRFEKRGLFKKKTLFYAISSSNYQYQCLRNKKIAQQHQQRRLLNRTICWDDADDHQKHCSTSSVYLINILILNQITNTTAPPLIFFFIVYFYWFADANGSLISRCSLSMQTQAKENCRYSKTWSSPMKKKKITPNQSMLDTHSVFNWTR